MDQIYTPMRRAAIALALLLICIPAFSQEIRDIQTAVNLYRDGSAQVIQQWDVTVTKGTERYIPIDNPGKCYIHDFRVFENDEEYENEGRKWNSNRSAAEKAGRCGIIEKGNGNIELCWGQGEYGDHVYILMYVIDNLVQDYGDCDGFHWHFLNDQWEDKPQHASIVFFNETGSEEWYWNSKDDNNVAVWPFGMVGESAIEEGTLVFESTEPFTYTSFFSVLVRFKKGLFEPAQKGKGTFKKLQKQAFKGSDYKKRSFGDVISRIVDLIVNFFAGLVFIVLPILAVLWIIYNMLERLFRRVTNRRYSKDIVGQSKIEGWCRDIPFKGNPTTLFGFMSMADLLAPDKNKEFKNLVSAYFLKWVQDGVLTVERDQDKPEKMNLRFVKAADDVQTDDPIERRVYDAALAAAGDNRLLEANEFRSWSFKNYGEVMTWPKDAIYYARPRWKKASVEERRQAVEFKNYLNDFTLLKEREAPEIGLWKQYMVLAAALGIAEKVAKNFEKLFPKEMEEYSRQSGMADIGTTHWVLSDILQSSNAMMASAINKHNLVTGSSVSSSRRSFGGGGSISTGGGRGGFGGGHGGGAR